MSLIDVSIPAARHARRKSVRDGMVIIAIVLATLLARPVDAQAHEAEAGSAADRDANVIVSVQAAATAAAISSDGASGPRRRFWTAKEKDRFMKAARRAGWVTPAPALAANSPWTPRRERRERALEMGPRHSLDQQARWANASKDRGSSRPASAAISPTLLESPPAPLSVMT